MDSNFIEKLIKVSEKYFPKEEGHNLDHALRVYRLSRKIHEREGGDLQVISISSILHDVSDHKFSDNEDNLNSILNQLNISEDLKEKVLFVINNISFSKNYDQKKLTIEAKIVQDADRLDALGAIGVIRVLLYSFYIKEKLFDANVLLNSKDYETTINHFFRKTLLLRDKMNTTTAKEIAKERHKFILSFLKHFFDEYFFDDNKNKKYWTNLLKKYE